MHLGAVMNKREFKKYLSIINELSSDERAALAARLTDANQQQKVFDMIEARFAEQACCPHCGSTGYHKHGHAHGLQRYRCKDCRKTFNSLTGTPLSRLRKREQWFSFLSTLMDSLSVRKAAARLGVNKKTTFLWRHRFLAWISEDKAQHLSGITEADETFFLYSEKGNKRLDRKPRKRGGSAKKRGLSREQVCVLVARDRHAETTDFIAGRGPINAKALQDKLLPVLDKDALLVSDTNNAYLKFSREADITYHSVNVSKKQRVDGAYHVQNVNAYHSRLKQWMRRFNGVATKYLSNYLGWRRTLDTRKSLDAEHLLGSALRPLPYLTGT